MYIKNFILLFVFLFFFSIGISHSDIVKFDKIVIIGNKNISSETIQSIANINKKKSEIDIDSLNDIQKKIFQSNFFSKVDIKLLNKTLTIEVIENPLIDYIYISGLVDNSELKNYVEGKISLKSDSIFSESVLNNDLLFIRNYLSSQGYLRTAVTFEVKKLNSGKVNVFLNVNLGNKYLVKNIFFIGNKSFSSNKLANVISTKEDTLLNFFSSSSIASAERLNYDISLLKNFYLTEGYYDIQISNASINLIDDKFVDVVFSINSGKKFIISNYSLNKDLNFLRAKDVEFINNNIKKYLNNTYNIKNLEVLQNNINSYLESNNIFTILNLNLNKISDRELSLQLNLSQVLSKKIISNISIVGNDITDEKVIRNNIFFSEGDLFAQIKIDKSLDLLKSLGFFKDVKINTSDNKNEVAVKISVEEKPTGEISGGLAIGSAASTISFNLKENNFLGQGILANFGFDFGTQEILGTVTFSNPDFNNSGNTVANSFYITETSYNNSGYKNKIIGSSLSIKYDVFMDIKFENGIALSYDTIDVDEGANTLIRSREGDYLTTKYFYNFYTDKRNKKFQPTAGYTFAFGQGISIPPSDIPSLNNGISGTYYNEISENFIGSIKYKIRSINSWNNNPVKLSDRVFVTDSELRGFSYRGIGPKISGDFIGGNYAYTTTFATTVPNGLPENWKASTNLFVDVANVWGSDFSGVAESNKVRSSIGVGLSWFSPIGPITFSYAEPISSVSSDSIEKFNFKLGGVF